MKRFAIAAISMLLAVSAGAQIFSDNFDDGTFASGAVWNETLSATHAPGGPAGSSFYANIANTNGTPVLGYGITNAADRLTNWRLDVD